MGEHNIEANWIESLLRGEMKKLISSLLASKSVYVWQGWYLTRLFASSISQGESNLLPCRSLSCKRKQILTGTNWCYRAFNNCQRTYTYCFWLLVLQFRFEVPSRFLVKIQIHLISNQKSSNQGSHYGWFCIHPNNMHINGKLRPRLGQK